MFCALSDKFSSISNFCTMNSTSNPLPLPVVTMQNTSRHCQLPQIGWRITSLPPGRTAALKKGYGHREGPPGLPRVHPPSPCILLSLPPPPLTPTQGLAGLSPQIFIRRSNANSLANAPSEVSLKAQAACCISGRLPVAISRWPDSARMASSGPGSGQWRSLGASRGIHCLRDEPGMQKA